MIYLQLFLEFFKIGLFSIGGGLATLPFIKDLIHTRNWFTMEDMLNMIAISESTPGPIGVNMATFVGNTVAGLLGGIVATLGEVFPSVIIIMVIAHYFEKFGEEKIVKSIFYGIRPAVVGILAAVCLDMAKISILKLENINMGISNFVDIKSFLLFSFVLIGLRRFKGHPIAFIIMSALIGIAFQF